MILFDTNILVYSQNKKDERYSLCQDLIKKSEKKEIDGVISSQNLLEFTSVLINLSKLEKPRKEKDVLKPIKSFESGIFKIIYPSTQTLNFFNKFLADYKTTPRRIFDMFLVATMLSNGVNQILTYNAKDFAQFKEIKAISP